MVQRVMRGAIPIRYATALYLKDSYPEARRQALRTWEGIEPTELPSIELFSPFELNELVTGAKPRLGIEVSRATQFSRTDVSDLGENEYRARYNTKITFWLYSQSDEAGTALSNARSNALRQRDDNMAILRACLLGKPSLSTDWLYLDEGSYTEEYFAATPVPNNSQRWATGGQITFDVQADEMLALSALNDTELPNTFIIETEVFLEDRSSLVTNIDKLR